MKKFVFWTGVYNIVLGIGFLFPPTVDFLQVPAPELGAWVQLPAILVIFLGVMLLLCSRDIQNRASIVFWEGLGRIVVAFLLGYYGLFTELGLAMAILGLVDLTIGLIYVLGLPRSLDRDARQLLLDTP